MQNKEKKIRVLIVDDSSMMRRLLNDLLSTDPSIEVVGSAVDPYEAREKLIALKPDVMTLDVEMPKMDGVTFLEKVMAHLPTRTLIISSLTPQGSDLALKALSVGAIEVLAKPKLDLERGMDAMAAKIVESVKSAASASLAGLKFRDFQNTKKTEVKLSTTKKIIAIGSSTGGTEALKVLLSGVSIDCPGIVIVQHMPPVFTKTFAEVLRKITALDVREASHGDEIIPGRVLLAPGNYHMEVERSGANYRVSLNQKAPIHSVRPAADYLFSSVAKNVGANAAGVILTGMGSDGAKGLLEMKQAGSFTFAQNEETCVIFGMPREAIKLGAVNKVLPIQEIAAAVLQQFSVPESKVAA